MKNFKLNFIIDILSFLCLSFIIGTGFLIKYILITGQETWLKYGENIRLEFLGLDRHEWGYIHLIAGFVMIVLMVLHILYHWQLIKSMFKKIIGISFIKGLSAIAFIFLCLILIFGSFLVNPDVTNNRKGERHHKFENKKFERNGRGRSFHYN
ncbi:DUF4405 domain-containing protein [Marinifilum sp. RC60d5]|uniref:DUF4405 domain-containing protein n=1 Tax=Marinifilum sp. RC60d5 TaxID=3458414 RepID=UPI00403620AA